MHRSRLPLTGTLSDGSPLRIAERPIGHLTQVAGWAEFEAAARGLLHPLGLTVPGDYRTTAKDGALRIWRTAPDRLLIQSQHPPRFAASDSLAILDLSDARVCLTIKGAGAAGLLARVTSLDFAPGAFAVGSFAQTELHHIGVLIDRSATDCFEIFVPTSWARSVQDFLVAHLEGLPGDTE